MASSNTLTFDMSPPRRPSLDDMGGAGKENDANADPPNPVTDPTAPDFNQAAQQAAFFGRVVPVASVSVALVSGAPAIASFQAAPTAMVLADFAIETESTHKIITVAWPASTAGHSLPPPANYPTLTVCQAIPISSGQAAPYVVNGTDGSGRPCVIVTIPTAYTALSNGPLFKVDVY